MAKKYIGYGITNEHGVATLDYDATGSAISGSGYTGTGAGKIDFQAELHDDGMIVSETYSIMDSIFYDEATSSATKNPNWTSSNISVNYENDYCVLSKTTSTTGNYTIGATLTSAFVVEWHNYLEPDGNNYFMLNGSNYLSLNYIYVDSDVKIIVESDKITLFCDGVQKIVRTVDVDLSQGVSPFLRIHTSSTHNIGYSNFKIYPL